MAKRWWAVPLLLAVLFVPLTTAASAAAKAPGEAAAKAPGETGKYYVVGPPVGGQREYLYSIALRTLGSGNRFREIVELNEGRKQPDGATFTDGVELVPGWILVLPRDAEGPGVRSGPLPAIRSQSSKPVPTTVAPSPSITMEEHTAGHVHPMDTVAARPPSSSEQAGLSRFGGVLLRGGAGVLAVVFAAVALIVLRRGVYRMRRVPLDDGPWPPQRHHTPTPAEIAAMSAEPLSAEPPMEEPLMQEEVLAVPSMATQGLAALRTAELTQLQAAAPAPPQWPPLVATDPTPAPSLPPAAEPTGAVRAVGQASAPVLPRPALPAEGDVAYVRADVLSEVGPIQVRLAGVATGPATPAYAWLAETEAAPPATVPLVLGRKGPWWLQVDLGRTPDVLTLVGAPEDCRRLAAAFARQLYSGGIGVSVVGDALGAETFDGCRSLTAFPEPGDEPADPHVVIAAGLPEGAGAGVNGLVAATGGRCVPVLIGPVPDGRWSVQVRVED